MRPSLCQSCLASLLKFLNFLQTFFGVSLILYSAWIFNNSKRNDLGAELSLDLDKLPAPWFVCALMGAGVLVCLIAFSGHVAAEATSRCCLCSYSILTMILILLEATLFGDIAFNKRWEEDLPYESTGELKRLRAFVETNMDLCQWVALTVIVIQVLALLLSIVLRAMVPSRKFDYDSDEDFIVIRRPLLNHQSGSNFASPAAGSNGYDSNTWTRLTGQKYNNQAGL